MNRYLLCACVLVVFLTGCGGPDGNNPSASLSEIPDQSFSQGKDSLIDQPNISKQPDVPDVPDVSKLEVPVLEDPTLVQTEYYNVTLPESWLEDCIYDTVSGEEGNYFLYFYEKQSYEQFDGGFLFSLNLLPITEDYTYFPAYDAVGVIETPEGKQFNLLALYPTDVQFEPDTQEKYMELDGQVPQVVASVAPAQDCTLSAAVPPAIELEPSRANGQWAHTSSALESELLIITSDGTFGAGRYYMGEEKEAIRGHYEILADDGTYQTFSFISDDGSESWTAQIWQTTLTNSEGVSYDGLVYITSDGETIYFTGEKYA